MTGAFVWGAIAASSLLLGGLFVMWRPIPQRALGLVMAFGAGVLISAVAFELAAEAVERVGADQGGRLAVGGGLALGALTFFAGDWWIDRMGGADRDPERERERRAARLLVGALAGLLTTMGFAGALWIVVLENAA